MILGGGVIGRAIYDRMSAIPDIFDTQRQYQSRFFRNTQHAISSANIIIGTTGSTSIPSSLHKYLKSYTVLAAAGSSDREFDAVHLRHDLKCDTRCTEDSLVTVPQTSKKVFLLSQGFPINFDTRAEPVPIEKIQLTSALMMSGVLDAHTYFGQKGIIEYPVTPKPAIQEFIELLREE